MHHLIARVHGDGDWAHCIQSMDQISIVVGWGTGIHLDLTITDLGAHTEVQDAVVDVTIMEEIVRNIRIVSYSFLPHTRRDCKTTKH